MRFCCVARTRSSTSSRITAGPSVRSVACSTLISLFICLITCAPDARFDIDHDGHARERRIERSRDRQAFDVVAARLSRPVTRISAPGLFSSSSEIICCIESPLRLPPAAAAASTISLIAPPAGTIG